MGHYLFNDKATGEDFIVGAYDLTEAKEIAGDFFERPVFCCTLTDFEAEISGLDEY